MDELEVDNGAARIGAILDGIWNEGHTPRLIVDATHKDVVVPEHVKSKWGTKLPIDLCANYPLNMTLTPESVAVDLAFSGSICRCTFPWQSIYLIMDTTTGEGILLTLHLPGDAVMAIKESPKLPDGVQPGLAITNSGGKPGMQLLQGGKSKPKFQLLKGGKS